MMLEKVIFEPLFHHLLRKEGGKGEEEDGRTEEGSREVGGEKRSKLDSL